MSKTIPFITFRIDDISLNTNVMRMHLEIIKPIVDHCKTIDRVPLFLFGVSPTCFDMTPYYDSSTIPCEHNGIAERIFPSILNAYSDQTVFYNVDRIGMPDLARINTLVNSVECRAYFCPHGMYHIDHRLISREAQKINIASSLSLVRAVCNNHSLNSVDAFIPPFNKINDDTLDVCHDDLSIDVVKWSRHDWKHLKYLNGDLSCAEERLDNRQDDSRRLLIETMMIQCGFYLHTHDFPTKESILERLKFITP